MFVVCFIVFCVAIYAFAVAFYPIIELESVDVIFIVPVIFIEKNAAFAFWIDFAVFMHISDFSSVSEELIPVNFFSEIIRNTFDLSAAFMTGNTTAFNISWEKSNTVFKMFTTNIFHRFYRLMCNKIIIVPNLRIFNKCLSFICWKICKTWR